MSGYLFAFSSTHDGIAARRALRGCCEYTLLPTPRAVTASCGIALTIREEDFSAAAHTLQALGLGTERISAYRIQSDDGGEHYIPAVF